MNRRGDIEYRVLRETIASRGTFRPAAALAGITAWSAILLTVLVLLPYPLVAAVPLLVLATSFEVIRTLHFGSERLGRYLEVFHEGAHRTGPPFGPVPAWEQVAMAFGTAVPGGAGHPMFVPIFLAATAVNFLAVMLPGPTPVETGAMAAGHVAFCIWLLRADRGMRRQRAADLARLRQLASPTPGVES